MTPGSKSPRGRDEATGCPLNNLTLELSGRDAELRAAVKAIFPPLARGARKKVELGIDGLGVQRQRVTQELVNAGH
jgi:hypothetical protein